MRVRATSDRGDLFAVPERFPCGKFILGVPGIGTSNCRRLPLLLCCEGCWQRLLLVVVVMKDFSNASFPPEMISVMEAALDAAVASLPEPVHSSHVQAIAEAILREAHGGERDPAVLQRLALMELQITRR
jgi:hypothetical protein